MKHYFLFFMLTILFPIQAMSQNLIEYKVYRGNDLKEEITYNYDNGRLTASNHVYYDEKTSNIIENMYTAFSVENNKNETTDTVETIYTFSAYQNRYDTAKVVKTYDHDGVKLKTTYFRLQNDVWNYAGQQQLYDSNGRLIKDEWQGHFCTWYSYNDKNEIIGKRSYTIYNDSTIISVDTLIYSADGFHATSEYATYLAGNQLCDFNVREYYTYDVNGNMLIRESGESTDLDTFTQRNKTVYRYNSRGQLKEESGYYCLKNTQYQKDSKTKYRYRHGLLLKEKRYVYDDGERDSHCILTVKNQYRKKLPIVQKYKSRGNLVTTKKWNYEMEL